MPKDSPLAINVSVPRIDYSFQLNGIVLKTRGLKTAEKVDKPPGMLVGVEDDLENIFQKLNLKLLADEKYQFLLALCDTLEDPGSIIAYDSIDEEAAPEEQLQPQGGGTEAENITQSKTDQTAGDAAPQPPEGTDPQSAETADEAIPT